VFLSLDAAIYYYFRKIKSEWMNYYLNCNICHSLYSLSYKHRKSAYLDYEDCGRQVNTENFLFYRMFLEKCFFVKHYSKNLLQFYSGFRLGVSPVVYLKLTKLLARVVV
jgi:hypothetical protein